MPDAPTPPNAAETPLTGCLLRILLFFFGNLALVFSLLFMLKNGHSGWAVVDSVYVAVMVFILVVRYLDIAFYHGASLQGQPATLAAWLAVHGWNYYSAQ